MDPSRMECGIESAVGLQCFSALLLDLQSMLFTRTCRTVSDCIIVTHFAKRWLILFVSYVLTFRFGKD